MLNLFVFNMLLPFEDNIYIFFSNILNIAFLISVEDVIDKSLAMELVVLMNFSITQSIESSSFPISSLRISNLF